MGMHIRKLEKDVAKQTEKLTNYHAYEPDEMFSFDGREVCSVLDFWSYSFSQLQAEGAAIAEFLVAKALGIEKAENVNYWTAYDMSYKNKRIEVKATRYVHPWNTKVSNVRTFSIEPTRNDYWINSNDGINQGAKYSRQSEVYVFCLNSNKDIQDNNPLRIDDWKFFVVPTFLINNYCVNNPTQKKISLGVVKKLSEREYDFSEIRQAVDKAIIASDSYYESL